MVRIIVASLSVGLVLAACAPGGQQETDDANDPLVQEPPETEIDDTPVPSTESESEILPAPGEEL